MWRSLPYQVRPLSSLSFHPPTHAAPLLLPTVPSLSSPFSHPPTPPVSDMKRLKATKYIGTYTLFQGK